MKHRIWRTALAVILVLVLLISWSPIRAQASVLGGIASGALLFGDDAIAIILAVLGGLGVCALAGSETSDLEAREIARNAMDAMEEAGQFVKDGALSLYSSVSAAWSYAVSTDMVQWLHDWMFDSGVVANAWTEGSANTVFTNMWGTSYTPLSDYKVYRVSWTNSETNKKSATEIVHFFNSNSYTLQNGTVREAKSYKFGKATYYLSTNTAAYTSSHVGYHDLGYFDDGDSLIDYLLEHYISVNAPAVTTAHDLTLGTVASPGTDIQTEYGDYIVIVAPNGVPDTGGDGGDEEQPKIPVLPIPYLPPSEIPNVPQEDIWKGNKVETENPDPGTGTDPDPGTGTDPDPGSGTDPDPGSGSNPDPGTSIKPWQDWLTPSGDPGQYGIQLRDFFPFCIPFDLYDFLSCLAADPVAPVFHWEIPVPQLGQTFEVDVDLSAWDSVAELFRRLELLAFIVGLAYVTREKYLRG